MGSEHIREEDTFLEIKETVIEANRKYWAAKNPAAQDGKWIYVYHGMSGDHFDWAVREDIVAKGLQEKTHLPITSVIDGFGRALPEGLDESFGITDSVHLFYSKYVDENLRSRTDRAAKALAEETYKDKDKLLHIEYRGIKFGDELYDHLLWKNWQREEASFDCFDVSMEQYAHYIRNVLSLIDHIFALFSQRPPAYVITTEKIQLKRLFGDIARIFGAEEMIILTDWPEVLIRIPSEIKDRKVPQSVYMKAAIEHYMNRPEFRPEKRDNLFVIESKGGAGRGGLLTQLGISNEKKNVFVLPHAFADAPRETYQLHFYHDYLEWFLKTLALIKKIPNVNWIIKDHPMTAYYKQAGYMKSVFMKNKTPNMYWCDSDISGLLIKDAADCIVTCGGEAALEYWAYGIPTITTAVTYFSEQGISYNMKSQEEYADALRNISDIAKPTEESSKRAEEILLAMKQISSYVPSDELANFLMSIRKMQLDNYRSGEYFGHIPAFCEGYMALLKRGSLEESSVYQMKNICDVPLL